MDGWMDGWIDGGMDGLMDGWMDVWMDEQSVGCMDRQIGRQKLGRQIDRDNGRYTPTILDRQICKVSIDKYIDLQLDIQRDT